MSDRDNSISRHEITMASILESLQEYVLYYDLDMNILYVNGAACLAAGFSSEDIKKQRCWQIWNQRDEPCMDCPVIAAMKTGEPSAIEKTTSDGRSWIVKGYPVKNNEGIVIGGVETTLEITDRKKAEEDLRLAHDILNRSPAAGFVRQNAPGWPVSFVTANVSKIFGHSADDFMCGAVSYVEVIHPEDLSKVTREVDTAIRDRDIREFSHLPYRIVTKDGAIKWVSDKTAIDRDTKGVVVAFRGIVEDITESRRIEADLQNLEKLRSLGVLAGGIAHDFNNFLTGIVGNVSLMKFDLDPADELYPSLNEMEKASLRAKDLTQQLLTFSQGGQPVKRLMQLDELVREASMFAIRGSNVRIEFDLPETLWPALVDEGQIAQIIHNLIFNADQSMPEGGTIDVIAENIVLESRSDLALEPGAYAKLTFRDRGHGIRKEHLARVFDPYFTTKEKGSGLGLAISFAIIEKHSGRIRVSSELGIGTTFTIYLPTLPGETVRPAEKRGALPTGSGRILVMDDEESILRFASLMLSRIGYEPTLAKDGAEAIELYRVAMDSGRPFAAVILDLTVPGGMGGKEALAELKALDKDVKAIVSSGYSNDPVISNFEEYGFMAAVKKPYRVKEMLRTLQLILKH